MKRRDVKRLKLSRETLHRMEEERLHHAAAGTGQPCPPSISICITHICISEGYTGCAACEM